MKYFHIPAFILLLLVAACGKPAYHDIDTSQRRPEAAPAETPAPEAPAQPATAPTEEHAPAAEGTEQPQQAEEKKSFEFPPYVDPRSGLIKDLPAYPRGTLTDVQIGPPSAPQAVRVYRTKDSVDVVGKFYDRELKKLGWKEDIGFREPDLYKVEIKKGQRDVAIVQARKDTNSDFVYIVLSRSQIPEPPAEQPKQ